MKSLVHPLSFTLILLALSACASSGDTGPNDDALAGDPLAMQSEGKKTIERGRKLVAKGDATIKQGRAQVRQGESKISEGNSGVSDSRRSYQALARSGGTSSTPKEVLAEAKRLRNLGDNWQESVELIKEGNALVTKGNKNINKGQGEVRDGEAMVDSGSAMLRDGLGGKSDT